MRSVLVALVMLVAGVLVSADRAHADIAGDRYTSKRWRVSMRAPATWSLNESTSYPNILLWMTPRDANVRMLLSAEVHTERRDSNTYAVETSTLLETLGFTVSKPQRHATGAYYVDFDNCGEETDCTGKVFLRQGFVVVGDIGYALTLAAPTARTRGFHLRAWDAAMRSLRLTPPRSSKPDPATTPATN
jgi:hypothetical protein